MNDVLTEVRFWQQVMTDAERTVWCSPDMESRCKGYVEARGLSGLITVKASSGVPNGQVIVVDERALSAAAAEVWGGTIRIRVDEPARLPSLGGGYWFGGSLA